MIYRLTILFLGVLCKLLFSVKIYGMEKIPRRGAFIMASNHASFLDPIVVNLYHGRKLNYLARETLFKGRLWSWYLRRLDIIPIDQTGARIIGLKEAAKRIGRGEAIALFPEGTRSVDGTFGQPLSGVGYFALRFNLPVIPVYVMGSDKAMPKGSNLIRRVPIKVFYGEPKVYRFKSDDRDKEYERVAKDVMEEIRKLKEHAPGAR